MSDQNSEERCGRCGGSLPDPGVRHNRDRKVLCGRNCRRFASAVRRHGKWSAASAGEEGEVAAALH